MDHERPPADQDDTHDDSRDLPPTSSAAVEWVAMPEAMLRLDLTSNAIRKRIRRGSLTGVQMGASGSRWYIELPRQQPDATEEAAPGARTAATPAATAAPDPVPTAVPEATVDTDTAAPASGDSPAPLPDPPITAPAPVASDEAWRLALAASERNAEHWRQEAEDWKAEARRWQQAFERNQEAVLDVTHAQQIGIADGLVERPGLWLRLRRVFNPDAE